MITVSQIQKIYRNGDSEVAQLDGLVISCNQDVGTFLKKKNIVGLNTARGLGTRFSLVGSAKV